MEQQGHMSELFTYQRLLVTSLLRSRCYYT